MKDLQTVVSDLKADQALFHEIVHGDETAEVATESGPQPSARKAIADSVSAAVAALSASEERAEQAATEAQQAAQSVTGATDAVAAAVSEVESNRAAVEASAAEVEASRAVAVSAAAEVDNDRLAVESAAAEVETGRAEVAAAVTEVTGDRQAVKSAAAEVGTGRAEVAAAVMKVATDRQAVESAATGVESDRVAAEAAKSAAETAAGAAASSEAVASSHLNSLQAAIDNDIAFFAPNATSDEGPRSHYDNEPVGFKWLDLNADSGNQIYILRGPGTWTGPFLFGVGAKGEPGADGDITPELQALKDEAATARDAAGQSATAAEAAKVETVTARDAAAQSATAAETAKAEAVTARDDAGQSATAAESAKTEAETARDAAAQSATAAETAKAEADTDRDAAAQSATAADAAKVETVTARDAAGQSATAAEAAKVETLTARDAAAQSATAADAAKVETVTARDAAAQSATVAEAAKAETATARDAAAQSATAAETAADAAEAALAQIAQPATVPTFTLTDPIDTDDTGTWIAGQDWSEAPTYSRCHQYSRGQFAISSNTSSKIYNKCRMRVVPFRVNQQTGAITWGNAAHIYETAHNVSPSTQAFGFAGGVGWVWGLACWGGSSTRYYGGCSWRVNSNNTVVVGSHTDNKNRTTRNNASNGTLVGYAYGSRVYAIIPNEATSGEPLFSRWDLNASTAGTFSFPVIDSGYTPADANSDSYKCYVWPCLGRNTGERLPGVMVYAAAHAKARVQAMAHTDATHLGPSIPYPEGFPEAAGFGVQLSTGEKLFIAHKACYVVDGAGIREISGPDFASLGYSPYGPSRYRAVTGGSRATSGCAAKEPDTWYVVTSNSFDKIRIDPVTYEITMLGRITLYGYDMRVEDGLIDVTGDDDRFIVTSHRPMSYGPNYTAVYHNPLKDL